MHFAPSTLRVAALLLILLCAGRAHAQGTQGALPDPITTPELMRYADRLGLSDEQRRAAERLHDEYRAEFRELREGEIAAFMESMRGMQGTMPQRRTLEDFMRTWDRLYGRIAQVDDRLFLRMQEILTDQQLAILPRVRLARERARISGGMQQMMMFDGPTIDLTTIVDALEMHPAERAAIDPALASYEHRLTAALREMQKASNRMILDMFNAFEAAGITEETMQDPEQMGAMAEAMQEVMQNMFSESQARATEMREINEGAFRSMRPALSEETGRALRNLFYSQAYPGVDYALRLPVEAKLQTAMSLEQISEPLRAAFAEMLTQTRLRADRILEDAIKFQKEQQQSMSPFGMDEDFDWEEQHRRNMELHNAAREIDREMNERLLAMLAEEVGEEAQQKVTEATHEPPRVRGSRSPFVVAPPQPDSDVDEPVTRSQHDHHLPAAITGRELTIYAQMLGVDEERLALLEQLHASYLERFEAATKERLAALAEARTSMWSEDTDEAAIERMTRLRSEALAAMLEADEAFFEEVALAVLGEGDDLDRLERVRLARQRTVYTTQSSHWGMYGRNSSAIARIDLARLVRLASLPAEELQRIDAALFDYEFEVADAVRAQYEAALAMEAAQQRWHIASMRAQREGHQMEHALRWQESMGESMRAVSEASRRVAEVNEAAIAELLSLLRSDYAAKLDETYRRRAFPGIYNDPAAVEKQLTLSLRLPDLTEQQRSHLAELIGEYRPAYVNMTERMVEIVRSTSASFPFMNFQGEEWQKHMDAMETIERLRFERNELNARAISRIKSILNDTQLTALGPLPEPPEDTGGMWGF